MLKRKPARRLDSLRGFLPTPAKVLSVEEMDDGVAAHLRAKSASRRLGG